MEKLPLDITADILSDLPMVLQLQCREVCKTWRTLLPNPKCLLFGVTQLDGTRIKAELYFSEENKDKQVSTDNHVDDNEQLGCLGTLRMFGHCLIMPGYVTKLTVVGSCNSLVCYAGYSRSRTRYFLTLAQVSICNPVTGKKIKLYTGEWDGDSFADTAVGFNYNRSSNEYKVVRILGNWVEVYTLKDGSTDTEWKSKAILIDFAIPLASHMSFEPSAGVFADGALHWIDQDSIKRTPVAFDLEHETLELLPPIPSDVVDYANVGLMVLGGNLCALDVVTGKHVMIWELRNRKNVKYTHNKDYVSPWLTKFSIAWEDWSWCEPFALTKKEIYLVWYNVILSCYDTETKTLRKLDETLEEFMYDCTPFRAIPFVNPLVSKAIMEERAGMKISQGNRKRKTPFC